MCECHFEFEGEVEFPPFHFEFKMCECHFEFEGEAEFPPFHFEFSGCKRCVTVTLSSKGKLSFLHSILSLRCVSVT